MFHLAVIIYAIISAWGLRKKNAFISVPIVLSLLMLLWFLPQLAQVRVDPFHPSSAIWSLEVMVLFSPLFLMAGWLAGKNIKVSPGARMLRNDDVIESFYFKFFLLTMTASFWVLFLVLEGMRQSPDLTSQWSGPIVIVATLFSLKVVPLYLSLILFFKSASIFNSLVAGMNLVLTGIASLFYVQRGDLVELGLVVLCALWFSRRRSLPKAFLLVGLLGAVTTVYTVTELRGAIKDIEAASGARVTFLNPEVWQQVDLVKAATKSRDNASDLTNAIYVIEYVDSTDEYTVGTKLWDELVFRYVPAQLVGGDLKQDLMFSYRNSSFDKMKFTNNFEKGLGTTKTGFGSAFEEFGYFGVILFFVIGLVCSVWWRLANAGSLYYGLLYSGSFVSVLNSFTHEYAWFYASTPLLLVFSCSLFVLPKHRRFLNRRVVNSMNLRIKRPLSDYPRT